MKFVQVKNPVTNRYDKLDGSTGKIVSRKQTTGPYKGVRIIPLFTRNNRNELTPVIYEEQPK